MDDSFSGVSLRAVLAVMFPEVCDKSGATCLLCGVAGVGKTTVANLLQSRGWVRLSIDEYIWEHFGQYGVDYEPSCYESLQSTAEEHLRRKLMDLLAGQTSIVVDFSFWRRNRRDEYRALIEAAGRSCTLLHLYAPRETLLKRLADRAGRRDANAAFPISVGLLDRYLAGFEVPYMEDAIHLDTGAFKEAFSKSL